MEAIEFLVSYITPYIAVIVLLGGTAYQVTAGRKENRCPHTSLCSHGLKAGWGGWGMPSWIRSP
jgi:hypothetical protein